MPTYFFMEPVDRQKYDYFIYLNFSEENRLTLTDIAAHFALSKTSAARYLNQLNADLALLFPEHSLKIINQNFKYVLENEQDLPMAYIIDTIRLHYLTASTKFKIIEALLQRHFQGVNHLAIHLHLSPSVVYKSLSDLRPILDQFNVSISFKETVTASNLMSDKESDLRTFIFLLYWYIFKGSKWPFVKNKPLLGPDHKYAKELSFSQLQKLNYLAVITVYRMYTRKTYVSLTEEMVTDFLPYQLVNDLSQSLYTDNTSLSQEVLLHESLFFNFLLRFTLPNCDSTAHMQAITKHCLQEPTPLNAYSQQLLTQFIETYDLTLSQAEWAVTFYDLNTLLLSLTYIPTTYIDWSFKKQHVVDNPDSAVLTTEKTDSIIRYYQDFTQKWQPPYKVTENTNIYIARFLHSVATNFETIPALKICVLYEHMPYLNSLIKQRIDRLFAHITYTTIIAEADLIISDSFQGFDTTAAYFYLYDFYDEHNVADMMAAIQKQLTALKN